MWLLCKLKSEEPAGLVRCSCCNKGQTWTSHSSRGEESTMQVPGNRPPSRLCFCRVHTWNRKGQSSCPSWEDPRPVLRAPLRPWLIRSFPKAFFQNTVTQGLRPLLGTVGANSGSTPGVCRVIVNRALPATGLPTAVLHGLARYLG